MTGLKVILQENKIDPSSLRVWIPSDNKPIYLLTTPGEEAIPLWRQLRLLVEETGHWPIVIGNDQEVGVREGHIEIMKKWGRYVPPASIKAGMEMDSEAWIQKEIAETQEECGPERWEELWQDVPPEKRVPHLFDGWPRDGLYTIPCDQFKRIFYPSVHLALAPTTKGWKTPGWLYTGHWNDSPGPEEQVCLFRRWEERYGAEVVGLARDRVEMEVARPPQDYQAALKLALEQAAFCPYNVDSYTPTFPSLARHLINLPAWHFWWD